MENHHVRTDDGWSIHLKRYPGKEPVLFVHGMGANSHNFDLNQRHSMARALAAEGYDGWVVELRGRGESRHDDPEHNDWNFEDFLHRDIRTAMQFIREKTRQPVHWVGHSMGGILGVAYLECYGDEDVRSLALFGTPLAFEPFQWMLKLWGLVVQVHRVLPTMDQEAWGRRMLPLMNRNRKALNFFLRYLANPDNVATETALDIFDKLVTNEASGIVLQFSDWVRNGQIRSVDKSFSYTDNLGKVKVPALFISGVHDLMAPAKGTARQIKRLGTERVKQTILSKKNGFSTDYGHGDLVLGNTSPREVYPLVTEWLRSQ
jgi:lysosomal acid lipase/cholesteryl ester hydrolase